MCQGIEDHKGGPVVKIRHIRVIVFHRANQIKKDSSCAWFEDGNIKKPVLLFTQKVGRCPLFLLGFLCKAEY